MEQLLKLKKELSEGKKEVEVMRTDIKDMENNLQQQEIIMKSLPHDKKVVSWSDLQSGTIQVAKMYRADLVFTSCYKICNSGNIS